MKITDFDVDTLQLDLVGDDERGYDFLDFNKIAELKNLVSENGVLTIYMDVSPEAAASEAPLIEVKNQLKAIAEENEANWSHEQKVEFKLLEEDVLARLKDQIDHPQGKSIAVIAAPTPAGRKQTKKGEIDYDVFYVFHLPEVVETQVVWSETPALTPLVLLKDEYPETGVVLFDRDHVRFFLYHMGEAAEYTVHLTNDERLPSAKEHTWKGYGTHNHQRWIQTHTQRYFRHLAIAVEKLAGKAGWKSLVLLSPDVQDCEHLRTFLSKAMQQKFIGEAALPVEATLNEVRDAVTPIVQQAEADEEKALLEEWLNELNRPNGQAVAGVADTIEAVQEYRVQTFLYPAGMTQKGWQCPDCGGVWADLQDEAPSECPYCGGTNFVEKADIMADAALQVIFHKGHVDVIRNPENLKVLNENGGVGAILRY